jgi:hypothetical protein
VLRFEVSRSVITVQSEFLVLVWRVFFKPCTKLTLHLGNWPRSEHEKRNAGSAWETWTVSASDRDVVPV